jgi:energy-coupling factor transport system ATP-binding protein
MAIKFEQVGYTYTSPDGSAYPAISNINLEIAESGEFIALIGETGSGKSTLVQHMNALLRPTVGNVTVYGVKIYKDVRKKDKNLKLNPLRQKVGLVFQFPDYQLFEETVERDIIFGPKNFGVSDTEARRRAKEAIQQVGLDPSYLERSPFHLSGGEKKRVSIAGILAMEPDILVLDEPTSGLDPKGRDALLELFLSIHEQQHKTIILITHDMNTVHRYATRTLVMNQGHLVFDGTPMDLFQSGDLAAWNLDLPDLLVLQHELARAFDIQFDHLAKTIEDLYAMVREVLL